MNNRDDDDDDDDDKDDPDNSDDDGDNNNNDDAIIAAAANVNSNHENAIVCTRLLERRPCRMSTVCGHRNIPRARRVSVIYPCIQMCTGTMMMMMMMMMMMPPRLYTQIDNW